MANQVSRWEQLMRSKINRWQPDEIATLTQLWPVCSASVIGTRLGRSRNAVIGEVFRQRRAGLQLKSDPTRSASATLRRDKPPPKRKPRLKLIMTESPKPSRPSIQCPCRLIELEPGQCKWPYGDPHTDDFYFCGAIAVEGHPYCPAHLLLAHQRDLPHGNRSRNRLVTIPGDIAAT
jgi:GcrA cell cycle regulator